MGVSESVQQIIVGDIFGKEVGVYFEGLIDVDSDCRYE